MAKDKLTPEIKAALLQLATGYEVEEKEITAGRNGKPEKVRVTKKHVPPDMGAIKEIARYKRLGLWDD